MNLHTSINLAVLHIMYSYGKDIYNKPFSFR